MKTKIYGTLGPACADGHTLEEMFRNGMTGMRLNLSHIALRDAEEQIRSMQAAAERCGVKPELLIDMQGPELRIGALEKETPLKPGDTVWLVPVEESVAGAHDIPSVKTVSSVMPAPASVAPASASVIPVPAVGMSAPAVIPVPPMLMSYLREGQEVLLDDGRIEITVCGNGSCCEGRNSSAETAACQEASCDSMAKPDENNMKSGMVKSGTVKTGGRLKSRKSICLKGVDIPAPAVTKADADNLKDAVRLGVTGIMQPFVRSRADLEAVREAMRCAGADGLRLFAKIENLEGVKLLPELLPVCDEIVIARGDLGNAMPLWELPGVQKRISAACRDYGREFMVVTQMLFSMEHSPVPTRAEVSDIFNAVLDGAASVMVTGETAAGEYPAEVIRYLTNTVREAEDCR